MLEIRAAEVKKMERKITLGGMVLFSYSIIQILIVDHHCETLYIVRLRLCG